MALHDIAIDADRSQAGKRRKNTARLAVFGSTAPNYVIPSLVSCCASAFGGLIDGLVDLVSAISNAITISVDAGVGRK